MPTFINGANRLDLDCGGAAVSRIVRDYGEVLNVRWNTGFLIFANRRLVRLDYLIRPCDQIEFVRVRGWKGGVPDGAPSWVTEELIEETIRVWQRFYEEPLASEQALALILTTSELLAAMEEQKNEEKEICSARQS